MGEETVQSKIKNLVLDISSLKLWATRNLSSASQLRALLLQEADTLSIGEFLAKTDTWLKLAALEDSRQKGGVQHG